MAATTVTSPAFAPLPPEISTFNFSFLVAWFGVLYHLFPALSYLVTKDWSKVFYDCFGPEILVADTFTTLITLWYHIFCPRKDEAMKFVIVHTFGLGLNVMSICMFAMFHSLSGGIKRAKYWYYMVLGSFAVVTLLTFMWIQMDITIENENDSRAYIGYVLAAIAEVYQVFWPAVARVLSHNFVEDEKPIFWLKIAATVLSIAVSSCELWDMVTEGLWSSHIESRFMVLSMINIIGGCLQLVARYIGPERFVGPVTTCKNQCYEWTTEKLAQAKRFFGVGNDGNNG